MTTNVPTRATPEHFLGALAADEAPAELAHRLAGGYREALQTLQPSALDQWRLAVYMECVRRGLLHAALVMITMPSEDDADDCQRRAATYYGRGI